MGAFFGLSQAGDELTATRELKGSNRARNRHSVSVRGGCFGSFGRCLARPDLVEYMISVDLYTYRIHYLVAMTRVVFEPYPQIASIA